MLCLFLLPVLCHTLLCKFQLFPDGRLFRLVQRPAGILLESGSDGIHVLCPEKYKIPGWRYGFILFQAVEDMVFTGAFFKRFDVAVRDLYVGKLTAIFRKFFKALFPMGDFRRKYF